MSGGHFYADMSEPRKGCGVEMCDVEWCGVRFAEFCAEMFVTV